MDCFFMSYFVKVNFVEVEVYLASMTIIDVQTHLKAKILILIFKVEKLASFQRLTQNNLPIYVSSYLA